MTVSAKPFVKWAGGKRRLLPHLLERLPERVATYFEPFVGGGAVFFALAAQRRFGRAVLGDSNAALIETYRIVRDDVEALIERLRPLAQRATEEEFFYELRAKNPKRASPVTRAARFIFLNKTCFNGLYRVNRAGRFNVPFGRYVRPKVFDAAALRASSEVLQGVELVVGDFEATVASATPNDAVYFDPPYAPRSSTARFTSYTSSGFTETDHVRLAECFAELAQRGVPSLLSNASTPFTRQLFVRQAVVEVSAARSISSKGNERGPVPELIVTSARRRKAAP